MTELDDNRSTTRQEPSPEGKDYQKPAVVEINLMDESVRGWSEPDPP